MMKTNRLKEKQLIRVRGELRYGAGVKKFRALIDQALAAGRRRDIVLDMAAVESVDSSGIGELVFAHRRLSSAGCGLTLLRPPEKVRRFLASTGLSALFGLSECADRPTTARMSA